MSGDSEAVSTVGRDDFFNDPFFKDWWADFDSPAAVTGTQLDRQVSGGDRNTDSYSSFF
jgi:hypothetical protein